MLVNVHPYRDESTRELQRVQRIKELARDAIHTFAPEWKQSNLNARRSELLEIRLERSLRVSEENELTHIKTVFAKIELIKIASNAAEAQAILAKDFNPLDSLP